MNRGVTTYDERDDDCDDEQLYGSGAALAMALVVQSFLGYSPRSRPRMIPGYRFRFLFVMTRALNIKYNILDLVFIFLLESFTHSYFI